MNNDQDIIPGMKTDLHTSPLKILQPLPGYRKHFHDLPLWEPYVRQVSRRHNLACQNIRGGVTGTFPTFLVDKQWVIKFFGSHFDGPLCFQVESEIGALLAGTDLIHAPIPLAQGRLDEPDGDWQYLIFSFVDGDSIGEVYEQVSFADKRLLAQHLGKVLKKLHQLPVPAALNHATNPELAAMFSAERAVYTQRLQNWFDRRRINAETGLPPHLAAQSADSQEWVTRINETSSALHLIHADVTRDHAFGHFAGIHWQMHALIDFGDCMTGDLYYELAALHLDLFDCNPVLLADFLDSYSVEDAIWRNFAERCMAATLLHQCPIGFVFKRHPELAKIETLSELTHKIWGIR